MSKKLWIIIGSSVAALVVIVGVIIGIISNNGNDAVSAMGEESSSAVTESESESSKESLPSQDLSSEEASQDSSSEEVSQDSSSEEVSQDSSATEASRNEASKGDSKNESASKDTTESKKPASTSETFSNTPHTHKYQVTVYEPTCQKGGYTLSKCSCGDQKKSNETAPTDHDWGEWITFIEPTIRTKGYKERFCNDCGEKEHQDLEKLQVEVEAASWEEEVLRLVNIEREKAGVAPLSYCWAAQGAADIRASEIATLFDHTRPDGTLCFTALDEQGVSYTTAGENIASGQISPDEVVEDWMNSPGHRANILDASFTQLAVGIEGQCWVQLFIG